MNHLIVGKVDGGDGWFHALEHGGSRHIFTAGVASPEALVKGVIKTLMKHESGSDFTFSTQMATELLSDLVTDAAALVHAAPGASITIFAPEGREGDPSMWASAWRNPLGGLSSSGIKSRFREQSLTDRLTEWFETTETWRSFRAETPSEKHSVQRLHRPPFDRIVLVRRSWKIRDLVPTASFPQPGAAFAAAR